MSYKRAMLTLVIGFTPFGVQANDSGDLNIWFGYAKEELACFSSASPLGASLERGGLTNADMVVFLELSKLPNKTELDQIPDNRSDAEIAEDGPKPEACENMNGGAAGLDQILKDKLKGSQMTEVLQVASIADDEPPEPDMALLSVWYNPNRVKPGNAFTHKNRFEAVATSACIEDEAVPRVSSMEGFTVRVKADTTKSQGCPSYDGLGPQYDSSKTSIGTSWYPSNNATPFAILGINLPSSYYKGKNEMLKRAMDAIETDLGLSSERTFIIGDLNTRLLDEAWDECPDDACKTPASKQERLDQSKQAWEIVPDRSEEDDDIDPCSAPKDYSQNDTLCEAARAVKMACRKNCLARLVCDPDQMKDVAKAWQNLDPKRGAGGFDLLPQYFEFPDDRTVHDEADDDSSSSSSEDDDSQRGHEDVWRWPTYKRVPNKDVCDGGLLGDCSKNPCNPANHGENGDQCVPKMEECFAESAGSKADALPRSDPLYLESVSIRSSSFVKPQMGWLDGFGYSKAMKNAVGVKHYEDISEATFGDHAAFVSLVRFSTGADGGMREDESGGGVISNAASGIGAMKGALVVSFALGVLLGVL